MEVNMEVEMEIEMEVEMKVEMDAPILQPNHTRSQVAPVYAHGKIGASILTSNLTSMFELIFDLPILSRYH